jgi:hypothetical protein
MPRFLSRYLYGGAGSRANTDDDTPQAECGLISLPPRWVSSRRIGIATEPDMQLDAGREDGRTANTEEVETTGCTHSCRNGTVLNHPGGGIVETSTWWSNHHHHSYDPPQWVCKYLLRCQKAESHGMVETESSPLAVVPLLVGSISGKEGRIPSLS